MSSLLDRYERFAFDLDGTVWRSGRPLPGAIETFERLRAASRRVAFVTNSPERSCAQVATQLRSIGIAAHPDEVVTSGRAAAHFLTSRPVPARTVYVIGGQGLIDDLQGTDLEVVDGAAGERASVVVVGRDGNCTYSMLRTAFRAVSAGALFVGTNRDPTHPIVDGLEPGGGALVATVEYASGVTATIVGKPEQATIELVDLALGPPGRTLVVGDKPETDLETAHRAGWSGCLVLTGVTAPSDRIDPVPHHVLNSLDELVREESAADGLR